MWDLSSLTRDQIWAPCIASGDSITGPSEKCQLTFKFSIEVQLIYSVVLVSSVQQTDSIIYIYIYIYIYIFLKIFILKNLIYILKNFFFPLGCCIILSRVPCAIQ